jgi:FAD/FMN-containing dehydrogenase
VIAPVTDPGVLEGYLRDASNVPGRADALFRPRSTEEVAEAVAWCRARGLPLTVTARRTSTTGAPVPDGGVLLSTEHLASVHALDDADAGVLLGAYQDLVEGEGRFFPPDPTSRRECSLGGALACNASGARSYRYGPARPWIESVEVVLPDGRVTHADRTTPVPWPVPRWREPAVKTAAGYAPTDNLLDLLIGSEGTLGIVTRVRTRLAELPAHVLGIWAYVPSRASMLEAVTRMRAMPADVGPRCIEYVDRHALALVRDRLPEVPDADSALYVEIEHAGEAPLEPWSALLSEVGADLDATVVADHDGARARLHAVRHAVPASINEIVARNGFPKLGTDFAVPAAHLPRMLEAYDATGLPTACFGHIGDSHLHLNFLPRTADEVRDARARYVELAHMAVSLGGTVSAEHGIGRHKKHLLAHMVGPEVIAGWTALRDAADPDRILGRGVMVD